MSAYSDTYKFSIFPNKVAEQLRQLAARKGTDLKLHINLNAFKASDKSSLVDPTNMDHRNKLETALDLLLSDIPEIDGISFEDFHWHMWSGYEVDKQNLILAEFARQMAKAIHSKDTSKKLSASMLWNHPQSI